MNRKHFTFLLTAISAIFCSNVFAFTVDPTSISENEGNRVNLSVAIDNVDWELAPENDTCDADVAFRFVMNLEGIDVVFNLLEKERDLRNELIALKNRLRLYEND